MGFLFSGDLDDEYEDAMSDRSMFNMEDKYEWMRRRERAEEIASGFSPGLFERDERIWEQVKKIEDGQ